MTFNIDAVRSAVEGVQRLIEEGWGKLKNWLQSTWGVVTLFAGWLWWFWDTLKGSLAFVATKIEAVVMPGTSPNASGLMDWLAIANTFFPLNELFAMMIAYIVLLASLKSVGIARRFVGWIFGL